MGPTLQMLSARPIVQKIVLANGAIILLGALAGTYVTRRFEDAPSWLLVLTFFVCGVTITGIVNFTLLRGLVEPLLQLSRIMRTVHKGYTSTLGMDEPSEPGLRAVSEALAEMLERLEGESRHYSSRLLASIEEERRRIGRELHDETSQTLAATLISLELAEQALAGSSCSEEVAQRVANSRELIGHALEQIKLLVYDLRPSVLDDLGLVPALRWYIKTHVDESVLRVELDVEGARRRLPGEVETALYRVAQEALGNVVRHAEATRVEVVYEAQAGYASLTVVDNGRGFDPESIASDGANPYGLGLLTMRERVDLLGGTMIIDTGYGKGTHVHVVIPLDEGEGQ